MEGIMPKSTYHSMGPSRDERQEQIAPPFDPIGKIEIDDAMLDVEIRVGPESSSNTWICHDGVCCNIACW